MAEASLSAASRAKASAANRVLQPGTDMAAWLREAFAPAGKPIDLGPHHYAVSALLDRLRSIQANDLTRLLQSAEDGVRFDDPNPLNGAQERRGFVQRMVCPAFDVIMSEPPQNPTP